MKTVLKIIAGLFLLFVVVFLLAMCGPRVPGADAEANCLRKENGQYVYGPSGRMACMDAVRSRR